MDFMRDGTILFPTMSWRFVKPDRNVFDELQTPSNTGLLTEIFRTRHAERRSLHPTHSVAGLGPACGSLLSAHHRCVTPCGPESPFRRLVGVEAHVLMLGIGMDCCTLLHAAEEEIAPDLYVRPPSEAEAYVCVDRAGGRHDVTLRRHQFLQRDYWQCQDRLHSRGELQIFAIDNSICRVFAAQAMFELATGMLRDKPSALLAESGQRYRWM